MNFNTILILKGTNIKVVYTKMYETVAKMVLQHYDTPQFNNNLFIITILTDENSNNIDFREAYPNYDKYIYYQLQNLTLYPEYKSHEYIGQFDEIWDFSHLNIEMYPEELKERIWYMPLRYVDIPKIPPRENYRYDIGYVGILTPNTQDMLYRITRYWTDSYCRVKIISGYSYTDSYNDIADCKYIIDIPRDTDCCFVLNASRIMEVLCSGKQIITEIRPASENIFTWLIKGYTDIYTVQDLVKEPPIDNSEVFKIWTDSDERYEIYRKYWMGNKYKQKLNL